MLSFKLSEHMRVIDTLKLWNVRLSAHFDSTVDMSTREKKNSLTIFKQFDFLFCHGMICRIWTHIKASPPLLTRKDKRIIERCAKDNQQKKSKHDWCFEMELVRVCHIVLKAHTHIHTCNACRKHEMINYQADKFVSCVRLCVMCVLSAQLHVVQVGRRKKNKTTTIMTIHQMPVEHPNRFYCGHK